MRPSKSTQLLDTVSNKKSQENTPEDETATSIHVEEDKEASLGKEIAVLRGTQYGDPLQNTTVNSGLQNLGESIDLSGSQEEATAEEVSMVQSHRFVRQPRKRNI